ncbi:hypothetical protein LJB87_03155, partial [Alistipes sp. OttesenSCG-928-L06]|nr:hypothetical protein [Alistipes sp. OttesenSCG-928-L06]
MKLMKYTALALAGILLVSCGKENDAAEQTAANKSITISLQGLQTKASSPANILTDQTKTVNNVTVVALDGGEKVIVSRKIASNTEDWTAITSPDGLKILNIDGVPAKVYVFGNDEGIVTATKGAAMSYATTLANQQGAGVLYMGVDEALEAITSEPHETEDGTRRTTYTAEVNIAPVLSRFQVKSVNFKTAGQKTITRGALSGTLTWDGFNGDLMGVYMNDFYTDYPVANGASTLYNNTWVGNIVNGKWLFNGVDALAYAGYCQYVDGQYQPYAPLTEAECFAFNFFTGAKIPQLHFDLANLVCPTLTCDNPAIFNPSLFPQLRFANVVKYYKTVEG